VKALDTVTSSIKKRWFKNLVIGIEIILLILTAGIAIYTFNLQEKLIPKYEKKLQKKLHHQLAAISTFLDQQTSYVTELSKDDAILNYMELSRDNRPVPELIEKNLASHVNTLKEDIGFKSLSLIANNGTILFSTNSLLRHIKLNDEVYSQTPLYLSFYISSMDLAPDFSYFFFSNILKETAFYVTAPLFKDRKVVGIIAFQIDEKKLESIARDYIDLGDTGETVLAEQSGNQTFFITPTRNNPSIKFSKVNLFSHVENLDIERAARGETGHGIVTDYLGKKVLSTWTFIPEVTWGIVVKINIDEIKATINMWQRLLLISAICALLFGLFVLVIHGVNLFKRIYVITNHIAERIPHKFRYSIIILIIIFIYLTTLSIYNFQQAKSKGLQSAKNQAIEQIKKGIQAIESDLQKISLLADFIAQDLQTERTISLDIKKRMRRQIVETDGLVRITIAYNPHNQKNNKLYAPSIAQNDNGVVTEEMINESYDYTSKSSGIAKTQWYILALETKKPQWLNARLDPASKDLVITYSLPFFFKDNQSDPAGVVSINFQLRKFVEIAQDIGIGPTGYTFIVSKDGTFLYHPIKQNTQEKKTLIEYAQEENNEDLEEIAKEIKLEKPIFTQFLNPTTQSTFYIYTQPITLTGWTIATVFSAKEVGLTDSQVRQYIFYIIILIALTLLTASFAFSYTFTHNRLFNFLNFSNIILFLALICLWCTIQKTISAQNKYQIIITDQSSVNKFVTKQIAEAKRENYDIPLPVPCGVELYAIEQTSATRVSFSGHIWHKYHKILHKDVKRNIRINETISYSVLDSMLTTEGDWDIVGDDITATIYHEHDYRTYPFDEYHIVIPLEHTDLNHNILLTPDLSAYASLDPWKKPGLETNFAKNSILTKESFYNYSPYKPSSDWGIRKFQTMTDQYRLAFNSIMRGDIMVPFISFCLPLLVILISIFIVLALEKRDTSPVAMIASFTGLLFSLVLLHRSIHEIASSNQTLYIEYAILYTYIVLILLIIHSFLLQRYKQNEFYQSKLVPCLKVIFWPIQLTAWIITTVLVFI